MTADALHVVANVVGCSTLSCCSAADECQMGPHPLTRAVASREAQRQLQGKQVALMRGYRMKRICVLLVSLRLCKTKKKQVFFFFFAPSRVPLLIWRRLIVRGRKTCCDSSAASRTRVLLFSTSCARLSNCQIFL